MFYGLPAETVFEVKRRTQMATVFLFFFLILLYVFFIDLMAVSFFFLVRLWVPYRNFHGLPTILLFSTGLAFVLAVGHFLSARGKTLTELLVQMEARPADPLDTFHAPFIHMVEEASMATGIRDIQPVVLSTSGCNAFSVQDTQGNAAIGVTEGILTKLTRNELSAVIAHEAAHLVHEDSRLVTTACFLFGFFGDVNEYVSRVMTDNSRSNSSGYSSSRGDGTIFAMVLWVISGLGYLMTKLVFMAISREREYLADADGVKICKDPMALADGLYKISHRYRGDMPDNYKALFIMNPSHSDLDEQDGVLSGFFSDHPPVSRRLQKILQWAKSDLASVQKQVQQEEAEEKPPKDQPAADGSAFMTYLNDQWAGPYTIPQLLATKTLTPATWVCPAGSQEVHPASEVAEFLPFFQQQVQGAVSEWACPRCKVSLLKDQREGVEVEKCSFCQGHLLRGGLLERMIAREQREYSLDEIKKARTWRNTQQGPLKDRDNFPEIKCPYCQNSMSKCIHSALTQVVVDRCTGDDCRAIWCDGGELETIEMLMQDLRDEA